MDKEFYDKYGKELDCKSCIGLQECSTNSNIPLCDKGYRRFAKDKIADLETELAEKDKEIAHLKEKDNYHLRYELAGADETITNLKQQLEEKDKLLKCYQEEEKLIAEILGDKDLTLIGSRAHLENLVVELKNKIKDRDIIIEEKDKEIELLKHLGKHETTVEMFKENAKLIIEKRQFAIQELEKVKTLIQDAINFEKPNFVEVYDAINKQIKELKGEKDVED